MPSPVDMRLTESRPSPRCGVVAAISAIGGPAFAGVLASCGPADEALLVELCASLSGSSSDAEKQRWSKCSMLRIRFRDRGHGETARAPPD